MGFRPKQYAIEYFRFSFRGMDFIEDKTTKIDIPEVAFRMMPVPLLKLAGNLLYRHQG